MYERIATSAHVDPSVIRNAVERSDIRERYERGVPELAEANQFLRALRQLLTENGVRPDLPLDILRDAWCDIFWEQKEVSHLVRLLKRTLGIPLVLLSDTNELHYEYYRRVFPHIHELFDVEILSFDKKLSKEQGASEILALALNEARRLRPGILNQHVLYVDDRPDFVAAARELGIAGHVFCQPMGLRHWLLTQGLNLPDS